MSNKSIDNFLVNYKMSAREAMKKLDESQLKILFVIMDNKILFGALTDGDIRRWILGGNSLDHSVGKICNRNPITSGIDQNRNDIKNVMSENRIQAVPKVDEENRIVDLLFWDSVFETEFHYKLKEHLDIPVVIMAGGSGSRLDPITRILPKPLIPIGEKTIIEIIIDKFREYGIEQYYFSVHHKAKMIKAYFDEINPSYSIRYLEEQKPLGTIGALSQLQNVIIGSLISTNCDTIINCNYKKMLDFHNENSNDITIVGSMINYRIPYGICEITNGGKLVNFHEKPEYSYLVSTGMYIIRDTALKLIPHNEHFNITDLISLIRDQGGTIGVYPISEKSWLDTGEWKEYKKTVDQLKL